MSYENVLWEGNFVIDLYKILTYDHKEKSHFVAQ